VTKCGVEDVNGSGTGLTRSKGPRGGSVGQAEHAQTCPPRGVGFTLRAGFRGLGVLCVGLGCGCYAAPAEDKALPASASAAVVTDAPTDQGDAETPVDLSEAAKKDGKRIGRGVNEKSQDEGFLVPEPIPGAPNPERPEWGDKAKPRAAVELPPNAKLDAGELQRAIDGRFGKLQDCIREDSVAKVSMKVAAGGELTQVRVLTSQPDSPILRDCVETALKGTRLANSRGSDDRPVVVTLSLRKDG
jgi:hypothetical protein